MAELAGFFWGWLLLALLLGFAMGWIAVVHRGYSLSRPAAGWLAASIVLLAVLAAVHLVPGRVGFWLDLGMMLLAAYLVGCTAGSWLRDRVLTRSAATP